MSKTIRPPIFAVHKRTDNDDDPPLCGYSVQFVLPVDNPVDNVLKRRVQGGYIFEVPINTPDINSLNLTQLLILAEEASNVHITHSP